MRNLFNLMINAYIEKFNISPLEAFSLLYGQDSYAFLYESLELGGTTGRYSFLGGIPKIIFKAKNGVINLMASDSRKTNYGNPFLCLRDLLKLNKKMTYFAPLTGGAVGYVSYDSIRYIEKIPDKNPDEINMPDLFFIFPQEFIIFDHKYKIARIIMYYRDSTRLKFIKEILRSKPMLKDIIMKPSRKIKYNSNFTPQEFHNIVKRAKDYIFAGDIFQVVLSQRFKTKISSSPFAIYRVLRITNPSPYMYYLKLNDITVLGSSPEILIKLKNRTAISRPLAGTKPRGRDSKEDKKLEKELLKEDKEIAEHIMLVDLARNDLGKVCEYGTVKPTALLKIEKYSKVMHIVSNVTGRLRNDCDMIDLFISSFPAGTVSGAPKIRAMEIIDELEPVKRGLYAGAIGYFDFSGNMDFCIAIRTIIIKEHIAYIQGGAGIVADSIPEKEYLETINKTAALKSALEMI
ncbi:MAG: anthranilate synthase component I [candidate division WOR-3 bacterium]